MTGALSMTGAVTLLELENFYGEKFAIELKLYFLTNF